MKEIEKGIHEIHAQAREQKEDQKETQEEKTVEGLYDHVSKMLFISALRWSQVKTKSYDEYCSYGRIYTWSHFEKMPKTC